MLIVLRKLASAAGGRISTRSLMDLALRTEDVFMVSREVINNVEYTQVSFQAPDTIHQVLLTGTSVSSVTNVLNGLSLHNPELRL